MAEEALVIELGDQKQSHSHPLTPLIDLTFFEAAPLRLKRMKQHIEYLMKSYPFILAFCYEDDEPPLSFKSLLNELDGFLKKQLPTKWVKMNNSASQQCGGKESQKAFRSEWIRWQLDIKEWWETFQKTHCSLLKATTLEYLQESFEKIIGCFDSSSAPTPEELLYDASILLLENHFSKKIAPYYKPDDKSASCFICYSGGNPTHVARVHKIAAHLRQAGLHVKLDIWHNTRGQIPAYIDSLGRVNYPIVMGSPDFSQKWENFVTGGASENRSEKDYRGNVLAQEIGIINTRMTEGGSKSGVVRVLIAGDSKKSFPISLRGMPDEDLSMDVDYCTHFFGLLEKLPRLGVSEEYHQNQIAEFKKAFHESYQQLAQFTPQQLATRISEVKSEVKKISHFSLGYEDETTTPSIPSTRPSSSHTTISEMLGKQSSMGVSNSRLPDHKVVQVSQKSPQTQSVSSITDIKGSQTRKQFITGKSKFKDIVDLGGQIVDKSLFIQEVLDDKAEVKLIIRPRRFGKTFNLSMLQYFLNPAVTVKEKEEAVSIFKPFKIWSVNKGAYQAHQGEYPVIFLTLKDVKAKNFSDALENFREVIRNLYQDTPYLKITKKEINNLVGTKGDKTKLKFSLERLTGFLHEIFKKRAIILIDEYDTPLHAAYSSTPPPSTG